MDTSAEMREAWRRLYAVASGAALLYVVMVVVPLVLVFAAPGVPGTGGAAVLEYIAAHKAVYLVQLVCFVGLSVPALVVFTATSISLYHAERTLAVLGGLIGVASEIVALALGSSPQSLNGGLVILSDQYMLAAAPQRLALATAAESLVAATNAVSWAGILTALGILLISIAMLRGVFHKGVAYLGIVAGALGIVSETFRPSLGMGYILYGLLLPAWFVAVGVKLLRLGSGRA